MDEQLVKKGREPIGTTHIRRKRTDGDENIPDSHWALIRVCHGYMNGKQTWLVVTARGEHLLHTSSEGWLVEEWEQI